MPSILIVRPGERDRLNLVFGVTVRIDNRDGALLPGLPVQATIVADAVN